MLRQRDSRSMRMSGCRQRHRTEFQHNVGNHECNPRVCFGRPLAGFIQRSLGDEQRVNLLYERLENGRDHKDGKDDSLHPGNGRVCLEE